MSYSIYVHCPCCGSILADHGITSNYAKHFDYRSLCDKTVDESIPILEAAVQKLGVRDLTTDPFDDSKGGLRRSGSWNPRKDNVGLHLSEMLESAKRIKDMGYGNLKWEVNW